MAWLGTGCRADSHRIAQVSPCQPDNNAQSVYIGAWEHGCGECGDDVPVREASWGAIKALFR